MGAQMVHHYFKIIDVFRRIGGQMDRRMSPFCSQYNITPLQLGILLTLHFEGPKTVSKLSERVCIANTNNSALCKKLEKDQFVTRQRGGSDERQVLVSITGKGENVVQHFSSICQNFKPNLHTLTQEELDAILHGLELLAAAMEETKEEK